MPNTNRPDTTDCDHRGYTGCTSCGCSECGALVDRDTLRPLTLPSGRVVYACPACLAEGDTGGVPVAVEEERSGAQTVRAAYEPIGAEGLGEVRAKMPLKTEAVALLNSLPRQVRTCQPEYAIALALSREELVRLDQRTVLGNGQVRYLVEAL